MKLGTDYRYFLIAIVPISLLFFLANWIYSEFIYMPIEVPEGYIVHIEYWFIPTLIWVGLIILMVGILFLFSWIWRKHDKTEGNDY